MKYKNDIFKGIHEDAVAMFEVGGISADRMREYNEACLVPEPETARKPEKSPKISHLKTAAAGV